MPFPKQPKEIEADRQAKAPYNFVSLPERIIRFTPSKVLPDQDRYWSKRLTGYVDCTLTTESPVYTRAAVPADLRAQGRQAKQESAFFYVRHEDEPVIPGSSLRGLLRGLVEIVSYSKVGPVGETRLVYRAVGDTTSHGDKYRARLMRFDGERDRKKHYTPRMRGGYLVRDRGEWKIRPAQEHGGTTYAHWRIDEVELQKYRKLPGCENAYVVYIRPGRYDYQPVRGGFLQIKYAPVLQANDNPQTAQGWLTGTAVIARSGYINSKRSEAVVYAPDESAKLLDLTDDQLDMYREQVSAEQEKLLGKGGALREGQPIFYILEEDSGKIDVAFFGHCRMLRLPYLAQMCEFVPEALRREADLDLAEAIFGYTKQDENLSGKERAFAGRVFVSDATLAEGQSDIWLTPGQVVVPGILGSPKPTTFQHYLVQTRPNKKEDGFTRDGRPRYVFELSDYASPSPGETVIRGHKLYWHKGAAGHDDIREKEAKSKPDKQHTEIQPVRAGVGFNFRLNFENLLPAELGALLWVLDVAADDAYRLKIGMGKPLGMGAIKVTSRLFLSDRATRYTKLLGTAGWEEATQEDRQARLDAVAEFERLVLKSLGENVRRLADVERVRELLAMLSWPGPDPAQTRYLEIERREGGRKFNEYRDRPVLPGPLTVAGRTRTGAARPEGATRPAPVAPRPDAKPALAPGELSGVVDEWRTSFGFIRRDDGRGRVFVHRSQLQGGLQALQPGQRVAFRQGNGMKGPEAQNVRVVG